MRRIIILLAATFGGCRGSQDQTLLAQQRAAAAGYRLEHFEQERLLFVHHPDGEKDGVELATLQSVFLGRLPASESADGKAKYFWFFRTPERAVGAPFRAAEPSAVVGILKRELAGFDETAALRMVTVFESNRGSLCVLWASPEYLQETHAKKEDTCRP